PVSLGCCYRSGATNDESNQILIENLKEINNAKDFVLCGDFNCPHINWSDCTLKNGADLFESDFLDLMIDRVWEQHVSEPTRVVPGQRPSLLDLIITGDGSSVSGVEHLNPL